MIKVLFLIEHMKMGGAENVLCNLVNHLDPTKFEITVQTIWPNESGQQFREGIRLRSCYRKHDRWTNWLMRLEAHLKLTYPLRIRDDYDVECAFLEFAPTKILAASTNRKAKKAAWVHCDLRKVAEDWGTDISGCRSWYQQFDKVVCVSQDVRKSYQELFPDAAGSMVLHNVVNDAAIREKASLPLPEGTALRRRTVVSVGRLESQKNYDGLLRIHNRLMKEGYKYDLWILGKGGQREQLEEYIRAEGLRDSVKLLGYVENPYPYLREAEYLVCSSKYEGFSTFVTEGLILGKAIVTTDCTGMKEQLGDSEFGLITPNDEESLYQGMKKMLSDDSLRKHYEEKALQRGKLFSAQHLVHETEAFLLSLVVEG